jgi:hypothetical protein
MSQFDAYSQSEYVRNLCAFLGKRHLAMKYLQGAKPSGRKGRLPRYADSVIEVLEAAVNVKAMRCECSDSSFAERFGLACAYRGMNNADVAQGLGVSREIVRCWKEGTYLPSRLSELACVVNAPLSWLQHGGEQHLPANSHIGVRVGEEALAVRERLYSLTMGIVNPLPDTMDAKEVTTLLEHAVMTRPELLLLARRAGGRWHIHDGQMVFAPWLPIQEHGLVRRYWCDDVEAIIREELDANRSVYGAWKCVKQRSEEIGQPYPSMTALHKRMSTERKRLARFGVDINASINAACQR